MNSYWDKTTNSRLTRRRALAASGAALTGAALLAACGGSDKDKQSASSLVTEPVDTSKQAKAGGVFKWYMRRDIVSFDHYVTRSPVRDIISNTYSKWLNFKAGYMTASTFEVEGEAAEAWELSPDGLQLTLKLRPGMAFAPIAPVNGRVATIEDAAYTWKKYEAMSVARADWFNSVNPQAPVVSVSTPDSRSIAFKLAFPVAGILAFFANEARVPWLVPKEEEKYDQRQVVIGTGPWYLSQWEPSQRFVLKKTPGYWQKELPYIDEIQLPLIPEYATKLAQFRTGSIYYFQELRKEEMLDLKRELPALQMYAIPPNDAMGPVTTFGWKPSPAEKTPFRDERVRQALSMSRDRDAYLEVQFNISAMENAGLEIDRRLASPTFAGDFEGWWLNPRSKDFGPNAKYLEYDIAEAKKLIAAAGYSNGLEVTSNKNTGQGPEENRLYEIYEGMSLDAGFKFNTYSPNPTGEWTEKFRDARGNFEGLMYQSGLSSHSDAVERLIVDYHPYQGNSVFPGHDPDGKGTFAGDPTLESMLAKARQEFDTEKRKQSVYEIQRYLAKKLYILRGPGTTSSFEMLWPVMKNHKVYRTIDTPRYSLYDWLDPNEAPLRPA